MWNFFDEIKVMSKDIEVFLGFLIFLDFCVFDMQSFTEHHNVKAERSVSEDMR
jgi:hypothetical protein